MIFDLMVKALLLKKDLSGFQYKGLGVLGAAGIKYGQKQGGDDNESEKINANGL